MSRRVERERREARAVEEVVDEVLTNWGIEIDIDSAESVGDQVSAQIGPGEAVECGDVYSMIRDVALEVYKLGRMAPVVKVSFTEER